MWLMVLALACGLAVALWMESARYDDLCDGYDQSGVCGWSLLGATLTGDVVR